MHHGIARTPVENRGQLPEGRLDSGQPAGDRNNPLRADKAVQLHPPTDERDEVNQAQSTRKNRLRDSEFSWERLRTIQESINFPPTGHLVF